MDVGKVMTHAEGFGHAVMRDEKQLISHYLSHGDKASVNEALQLLPRPIDSVEVLQVELREAREWITLMRFSGRRDEVRLRAEWVENGEAIHIRGARIFGLKTRELAS